MADGTLDGLLEGLREGRVGVDGPADLVRGQVIGRVGSTGLSTKPHLHFITYESGKPVNPEKYIGSLGSLRA